ncbi:hypothetical protein EDB81DRAFT_810198 [Dactylonectria macrodidyma]|uniref:BZIP domain-containing protein n=1 Tax=Dactylonectria macrodidyma TaxID=307937 RepID=A0A9P9IKT5_9HYPO|nr:hypothetical protein EDB81DRAFT_810198 [Dactylonectria macrodidyma]
MFRMFNPNAPKQDPTEKRRTQLRQAQQTYRQRKTRYTKALEEDLATCKAHEASLVLKCGTLSKVVQALQQILVRHGIDMPDELRINTTVPANSKGSKQPSPVLRDKDRYNGREVRSQARSGVAPRQKPTDYANSAVQLASPESLDEYEIPNRHEETQYQTLNAGQVDEWPQFTRGPETELSTVKRVCDLDPTTIAMEFVLRIEEPCLGHVHGDPNQPQEPSGHALTVTSQLHYLSPTPHYSTSSPSFHDTPAAILERLLTLTPAVSSEGDVTPIQAWNSLRTRPRFSELDVECLTILAEGLRDAAKCHGFGAVVRSEVFENLVYEITVLKKFTR